MSAPISTQALGLGIFLIQRESFQDNRGSFSELWNLVEFQKVGVHFNPKQVSISTSARGVLRGLHVQQPAQAKLVTLLAGHTYHVSVDVRPQSPTFGQHVSFEMTAEQSRGLLIPQGFAHGFVALHDSTVCYFCDELHQPESEWSIRWDDQDIAIEWPVSEPVVSLRDEQGLNLKDFVRHCSGTNT